MDEGARVRSRRRRALRARQPGRLRQRWAARSERARRLRDVSPVLYRPQLRRDALDWLRLDPRGCDDEAPRQLLLVAPEPDAGGRRLRLCRGWGRGAIREEGRG